MRIVAKWSKFNRVGVFLVKTCWPSYYPDISLSLQARAYQPNAIFGRNIIQPATHIGDFNQGSEWDTQ